MSEEKRFVQSQYAHHLRDTETDMHYYLTSEKIGCKDLFDEIERLTEENEMLKSENKKLQCINDQLEEQLENSGIGIALKMVCENDE